MNNLKILFLLCGAVFVLIFAGFMWNYTDVFKDRRSIRGTEIATEQMPQTQEDELRQNSSDEERRNADFEKKIKCAGYVEDVKRDFEKSKDNVFHIVLENVCYSRSLNTCVSLADGILRIDGSWESTHFFVTDILSGGSAIYTADSKRTDSITSQLQDKNFQEQRTQIIKSLDCVE